MSDIARIERACKFFKQGYACSQAILLAFSDKYGFDNHSAAAIASTFGGGMGRLRLTCGALTGAFMVIGLEYGNVAPDDMERKLDCYRLVREMYVRFETLHGTTVCGELLAKYCPSSMDVKKRRHHRIICDRLVKDAATILVTIMKKNT
jgi:C_GCAxxG_C_C family probable redox protein